MGNIEDVKRLRLRSGREVALLKTTETEVSYEPDDESRAFFMHEGDKHYLDEFLRIDKFGAFYGTGYHAYTSDSFFSGLLLKYEDEEDRIICHTWCTT